jgi:tRNA dimethylallyltransferase
MATTQQRPKLLAIVGPTASGKSDLAMKIAKGFNGEIICADSRTIYKGMNIATAKATPAEQKAVPHWGLDLIEPGETFSAGKFKHYAGAKILDIQKRHKLPILVGGTGLYVDGVLYDFAFIGRKLRLRRLAYSWQSTDRLQKIIQKKDWTLPENARNRRHLVRTIERAGQVGSRNNTLSQGVLLIGLLPPDEVLKERIASRADKMFEQGIIAETQGLIKKYGKAAIQRNGAIIYRLVMRHIDGDITEVRARELFKSADWQYARRQKTWFKRDPHIKWFKSDDAAYKSAKKQLLNT